MKIKFASQKSSEISYEIAQLILYSEVDAHCIIMFGQVAFK